MLELQLGGDHTTRPLLGPGDHQFTILLLECPGMWIDTVHVSISIDPRGLGDGERLIRALQCLGTAHDDATIGEAAHTDEDIVYVVLRSKQLGGIDRSVLEILEDRYG